MSHFDVYGRMAAAGVSETLQNGRYLSQQEAEQHVPADITAKLTPNSQDSFLDIGCGLGLNLFPISQKVKEATGCDHPNVIKTLQEKKIPSNVSFYEGDFLTYETNKKFTKILSYSVLPALPDEKTLFSFIDKALSLLSPNGKMLLGDIANADKKERFLQSERGQRFQKEWEELNQNTSTDEDVSQFRTEQDYAVSFNDDMMFKMLRHIRKQGFHAYVADQPQNLPFGNTREDILVIGPEYDTIEGA